MRIALHDGHIAMRVVALVQLRPAIDQPSVEIAPMGRQQVADAIEEPRHHGTKGFELAVASRKPSSHSGPESSIIPPLRV